MKKKIHLLMLLLLFSTISVCQDKMKIGWEFNAQTNLNNNTKALDVSLLTNKKINKHLDAEFAIGFYLYGFERNPNIFENYDYVYLNRTSTFGFSGRASLVYSQPIFSSVGAFGSAGLLFDPIPINLYKFTKVSSYTQYEDYHRLGFNAFSPGVLGEMGFYYDYKKKSGGIRRWQLGFGLGAQHRFVAFNLMKVNNNKVTDCVERDYGFFRITLR